MTSFHKCLTVGHDLVVHLVLPKCSMYKNTLFWTAQCSRSDSLSMLKSLKELVNLNSWEFSNFVWSIGFSSKTFKACANMTGRLGQNALHDCATIRLMDQKDRLFLYGNLFNFILKTTQLIVRLLVSLTLNTSQLLKSKYVTDRVVHSVWPDCTIFRGLGDILQPWWQILTHFSSEICLG